MCSQSVLFRASFGVVLAGMLAVATLAQERIVTNPDVLALEVSNASGTATYTVDMSQSVWVVPGQELQWSLPGGPVALVDDTTGTPVATLADCGLYVHFSPTGSIDVDFTVLAGSSDTTVQLQSPMIDFSTLAAENANGRAYVSFDLVDGPDGFAQMTSIATPIGTGAFRARYNGQGDNGTIFAHMIYQISIEGAPGESAGSINANRTVPSIGFAPIGADVSSISVDVSYVVTAGDVVVTHSGFELDQPIPLVSCDEDVNVDGVVDTTDLSMVLQAFGACSGQTSFNAGADINADGCVQISDVSLLLAAFGDSCF